MTLFEYLAIASSFVFSFAAMRIIAGLPHAFLPGRRYWVHLSITSLHLLAIAMMFWAYWSYRNVTWNLPSFLLTLAGPGIVYFNACLLIPESPREVASWRDHYYAVRRLYFLGISVLALTLAATTTSLLEMPLRHPARLAQSTIFIVGLIGATSDSPRIHAGIAIFQILFVVILATTLGFRPGSLS